MFFQFSFQLMFFQLSFHVMFFLPQISSDVFVIQFSHDLDMCVVQYAPLDPHSESPHPLSHSVPQIE